MNLRIDENMKPIISTSAFPAIEQLFKKPWCALQKVPTGAKEEEKGKSLSITWP
jgi:hypothetical protein